MIDPNANQTLNYFDTGGLPLTPGQLEFVTAFLTAMCGESSDLEVIQDRTALISPFVAAVYTDAYVEWRNRNREGLEQAARMALSVEKLIPSMPIDRNTALDAWIELRDALAAPAESPDEARRRLQELYNSWTIRELNDYIIKDPEMLRNISYAYMAKSDMPYHSQLVEALRETSLLHLDRSDLNRVAARLRQSVRRRNDGGSRQTLGSYRTRKNRTERFRTAESGRDCDQQSGDESDHQYAARQRQTVFV